MDVAILCETPLQPAMLAAEDGGPVEPVAVAARRLAHRLNNDLVLPAGVLELLAHEPDLPPKLRDLVREAAIGVAAATAHVAEFQRLLYLDEAPAARQPVAASR